MALTPELDQRLRAVMAGLVRPCASIDPRGPATDARTSYLSGHPYQPVGLPWPSGRHGPLVFVGQVNFAEVPPIPDFPRTGLLQWFVESTPTWGLSFDVDREHDHTHVRWYADLSAPPSARPHDPTSAGPGRSPLEVDPGTAMTFAPGWSVPKWVELPPAVQQDPLWPELAVAYGEDAEEVAFAYDEYVAGDESRLEMGSKIGGFASFTQEDPRLGGDPGAPGDRLLVELDAHQTGGWGDFGIAHLFGDPSALATGDTRSVWFHWDCS